MKRKLVITAAILLVTCGLSACAGSGNAKKTGSSGDVNVDTEKKVSKDRVLSEAVGAEGQERQGRDKVLRQAYERGPRQHGFVQNETEYTEKPVTLKSNAAIRFQEGARDNKYILYYDGKDLYNTMMIGLSQGRSYRQAIDSAQVKLQVHRSESEHRKGLS